MKPFLNGEKLNFNLAERLILFVIFLVFYFVRLL